MPRTKPAFWAWTLTRTHARARIQDVHAYQSMYSKNKETNWEYEQSENLKRLNYRSVMIQLKIIQYDDKNEIKTKNTLRRQERKTTLVKVKQTQTVQD